MVGDSTLDGVDLELDEQDRIRSFPWRLGR